MPIKGLTDRGLAFPEIGQIRKGAKKEGNKPGGDLTHFRVEFDQQEKAAQAAFLNIYGNTPAELRIIFPFNEIEKMWDAWYEAYTAGRMVARSDGEFIQYQLDDKGEIVVKNGLSVSNGLPVKHPENGIAGKDYQGKNVKFKASGRMKVIIPDLSRAAYLTLMTTSLHDIANISAQLSAFKELNHGQLAGIPFLLRRRPKQISTPSDNGNRVRRVKWLISIEADPVWVKAKLSEVKALAMPQINEGALLPEKIEDISDAEIELDDDDFSDFEIGDTSETGKEITEEAAPIELINPMASEWVQYAAEKWSVSAGEAAKKIGGLKLGNRIDKNEFITIVSGGS